MTEASRILVVDDESVIRTLLNDILTGEGFDVETASSAQAALDILSERKDDFVILFTDIMMPEMNGIELLQRVRTFAPSIIPIVMTAFGTLETARAAVKEGAYDYVLKPFSLSEIKLAVTNAIERFRLSNENARLREITQLFNISESIASIRDEYALLDFVLEAVLTRIGASRGSIMTRTPDGAALEVVASRGIPEDVKKTVVEMGKGISGWVAENVKPLLVDNITDTPGVAEMSRRLSDVSFISVPLERKTPIDERSTGGLKDRNRVMGVINVNEKHGHARFTDADLKMLSIVANHTAAALENVRLIKSVEDAHLSTLRSMALLLEAKDPYTHGHSERVRDYAIMAGVRMGLSTSDLDVLRTAAALHDIGKVGLKDAILNKETPPSPDEWDMIRRHPIVGYDVLSPVRLLTKEHLHLVRNHHERIDGTGYPDGLVGDQIALPTRVIAVADAYDAMSSTRAYRAALKPEAIIEQLRRYSGLQFDPEVAKTFIELIERGEIPLT